MNRKIKRVRVSAKDNKVDIEYEERNQHGKWDEFKMRCEESPLPSFNKALQALTTHVVQLCELPKDATDRLFVRGLTLAYTGQDSHPQMGVSIIAQLKLKNADSPLNVLTPHKIEGSPAPKRRLSDDCLKAVNAVIDETTKYIDGERAQTSMEV